MAASNNLIRDVNHPWGPNSTSAQEGPVPSILDIMSEDLVESLVLNETSNEANVSSANMSLSNPFEDRSADTSNDFMLAQILQYEFDKEYDGNLKREEKHLNKNSKLSISFSNYKICPEWYGSDSDDEVKVVSEKTSLDSFEARSKKEPVIPACGYTSHNNVMVTKHDTGISGRKNAERVMSLPPGVNTGDGGGFDMHLSNKVYNQLATSMRKESNRKNRVHDKVEKATTEQSLDPKTRLLIFKMVNNGVLDSVDGIISTGKEAVIFHAMGGMYEEKPLPAECALKVFKTSLADFKTRERYIKDDHRFKKRISKNNNRMTIQLWTEKEFHNLHRLQRAGIPSPKPLLIKKQVLVMSFIGDGQVAAPKIKDVKLPFVDWEIAYSQVVEAMETMFSKCSLVHGDMSEYNVLWYMNQCWIIDLGQAVEPTHPNALMFLYRDCSNIIRFFASQGVVVPKTLQLFTQISGIKFDNADDDDPQILIERYQHGRQVLEVSKEQDEFNSLWDGLGKAEVSSDGDNNEVEIDDVQDISASVSTTPKKSSKRRHRKGKAKNSAPEMYEGVALGATKNTETDCSKSGSATLAEEKGTS